MQEESTIIKEVIDILSKNEYRKNRYADDISWFEHRAEEHVTQKVRIAMIGVTSSGKSTLVNALLGEKILPVSIKPSSSIIITCGRGVNKEALIYFRDGSLLKIEGQDLNEEIIKQYADESVNVGNKYDVQQIDIKTPEFIFNENIQIIDSPGLDACDLEVHEKLTLEILLPTIDVCVFLSTVKASSDSVNKEKISYVSEKGKEIIFIQNMIDSIEPKLGKDGVILETKNDILNKHMERARNLLNTCCLNEADIIQISALYALKGTWYKDAHLYEASNLDLFVHAIENAAKKIIPKLHKMRLNSIEKRIDFIISTEDEMLKKINGIVEIDAYEIESLMAFFKKSRDEIAEKIKSTDTVVEKVIDKICTESSNEVGSYLDIIWSINKENLQTEKDILNIVRACESKKTDIFLKLNLDLRKSYMFPSDHVEGLDINDIKTKHETKRRLVKKEGTLNRGKRFVSTLLNKQWGYDEENYDEDVIDKESIINKVIEICEKNKNKFASILYSWSSNYAQCINDIYNTIEENRNSYKKKEKLNYNLNEIKKVYLELMDLKEKIKGQYNADSNVERIEGTFLKKEEYIKCSLNNTNFNLYKLAHNFYERNYAVIGKFINKMKAPEVFWIYDYTIDLQFLYRIHNVNLEKHEISSLINNGYIEKDNIIIIYENCIYKDELFSYIESKAGKFYVMYCIINAIQISSTEKHIINSVFLNHFLLKNNTNLNIVIDSSREFINADIIKELLHDIFELREKIKNNYDINNMGYVLISAKNPIYNMLLIECQNRKNMILSEYKELKERILENCLSRGTEERKIIEEILLFFMKEKEQ